MNKRNPMEPFLAAAVQDAPVFLDLRRSVRKACDPISKSFPETWFPGYPVWLDGSPKAALFENSIALHGPELEQLGKAAKAGEATTRRVAICTNKPNSGIGSVSQNSTNRAASASEPDSARKCTNKPNSGIGSVSQNPTNRAASEPDSPRKCTNKPNSLLDEIPGEPGKLLLRGSTIIIASDRRYLAGLSVYTEPQENTLFHSGSSK